VARLSLAKEKHKKLLEQPPNVDVAQGKVRRRAWFEGGVIRTVDWKEHKCASARLLDELSRLN